MFANRVATDYVCFLLGMKSIFRDVTYFYVYVYRASSCMVCSLLWWES